jgi:hypothetical protein
MKSSASSTLATLTIFLCRFIAKVAICHMSAELNPGASTLRDAAILIELTDY